MIVIFLRVPRDIPEKLNCVGLERVNAEEVTPGMRREAKVLNFGILYGMGVTALRQNLTQPESDSNKKVEEITRKDAQIFYDNYFAQFPTIAAYLESIRNFAKRNGYTMTLFGRKRYFSGIKSPIPFIRAMAERIATNAPIQGTATADIIKLAIRYANEDLKGVSLSNKAHLVLQIHDELVYEIEENVLPKAEEIIKKAMENVLERSYLHYKTDIPLEVHFGSGNNFGEVK